MGLEAQMVDVSSKQDSQREAVASATVEFPTGDLRDQILGGQGPKGPVVEVARVAAIQAAKRTGDLIPLCHPLGLDHVEVGFSASGEKAIEITCRGKTLGRTGVEMEAMTGAAVGALTVYDMAKGVDKGVFIHSVRLLAKRGGKSGDWVSD